MCPRSPYGARMDYLHLGPSILKETVKEKGGKKTPGGESRFVQ